MRHIDLHAMHYFFIGAAYFSFHLLLAYLVDHMLIHYAFVLASAVSIFLVTSYMRLVLGARLAFVEIGVGQFIYLVLFLLHLFLFRLYRPGHYHVVHSHPVCGNAVHRAHRLERGFRQESPSVGLTRTSRAPLPCFARGFVSNPV